MKYHIKKVIGRIRDLAQMIRVIFTEDSFIISYKSKFKLYSVETEAVLIIDTIVEPITHTNGPKSYQNADILYNPYRYPSETQKEYSERIKAGQNPNCIIVRTYLA